MAIVEGYDAYFSCSKVKLGYSGVCVYVKQEVGLPSRCSERITEGLGLVLDTDYEALDAEGRCLILEFGKTVLVNVYFPHLSGEHRQTFVMDYYACVRKRVDDWLEAGYEVILVGDMNAVHEEQDHADPRDGLGPTQDFKDPPNRRWLDQLLAPAGPLIDSTRLHHPHRKGMFTCWNPKTNARPANVGSRIDYILLSSRLVSTAADILPHLMGSDHCPVYVDLCLPPFTTTTTTTAILSPCLTSHWPQFAKKQKNILHYFTHARIAKPTQSHSDRLKKKGLGNQQCIQ
ncbi:Endonuclease/exonuclease/phosphatase [Sporodiniella umbellata]|nr:Endonuclease/exonuclease/phosphatase [Sporodiniella umbellata]